MEKVLIVGAGLSGYCVANEFIKKGLHVSLLDNGVNHSSIVAAGMINPLVFRRMTKSWRVDEFLPSAITFYNEIENATATSFFHPITIRRFFSSTQELGFWQDRQHSPEFRQYMEELNLEDASIHSYSNEFGSGRVKNAWHVDTSEFMPAVKSFLQSKELNLVLSEFQYEKLDPKTGSYNNEAFDLVVFTQGYLGVDNAYFNHLPLTQTKGETLTIELEDLKTNESYNRKCFVLPMGEKTFKIGSTYTWNSSDITPTEEGKNEILANLSTITPEKPTVLKHDAGIRPTTVDRRPLIGVHPEFNKLAIFNGLGAKGYLLAPHLAKEFVGALLGNGEMPAECGLINRTKNKGSFSN